MPNFRMGWLPDRPDFRDYSPPEKIIEYCKNKERIRLEKAISPDRRLQHVDLREWCSPIQEQGNLKSCTAIAGVALVEYFERKVRGEYIDASSLFLYKVARKLMKLTGDTGVSTRFTMKAMALFGIPPEEYWPYEIENFDEEPPAFCYAYAQHYQALKYFRLDLPQLSKEQALDKIKAFLAAGFPAMFGFTTYSSLFNKKTVKTGKIPYPTIGEKMLGGHAVVAVGYDDNKVIDHPNYKSVKDYDKNFPTQGALLIRNCWGEDWGKGGYGWLPYEYVLKGLATDWWSLLKNEWVNEGQFDSLDRDGILLNGSSNKNNQEDKEKSKNPNEHTPTNDKQASTINSRNNQGSN
ncbi:MAG: C1 family peptidase [Nostoc sp.]|uniref:C1 family peptidase n=1 Tax=Nostoc sp. TaxID=1180 RepID=UPI002FFD3A81